MIEVVVKAGQTLIDLAVQYAGDATALGQIARANDLGLTGEIIPGQIIIIPEIIDERKANYFKRNHLYPAFYEEAEREGIGYWIIEQDFIIS